MNRYAALLLGVCCMIGVGCGRSVAEEQLAAATAHAQLMEVQLQGLQEQNQVLEEETSLRGDYLKEYTRLVNQTLAGLEAITEREGMLRQIQVDMDSQELQDDQSVTIERRIQDNLSALESHIAASKRQRDELRRIAESSAANLADLQGTLKRLNALVAQKEQAIKVLRKEAEAMLVRIEHLAEENSGLLDENTELRKVYFVIDTREGLEEQGVIDRRGGFLGIGRKTRIDNLGGTSFSSADVETDEIRLGANLKKYQVVSNHREGAGLYSFEERGGEMYLTIANPDDFWKISRYLVVEVK